MHPLGALVVGGVAGAIFVVMFTLTQNRWKIDDVLGVWPLHGLCGAWGGLACGIFGSKALGGLGGVSLGAQLIGTLMGVAWAVARRFVVYGLIKAMTGLRLTPEEEYDGADLSIHKIGATPDRDSTRAGGSRGPWCGHAPPARRRRRGHGLRIPACAGVVVPSRILADTGTCPGGTARRTAAHDAAHQLRLVQQHGAAAVAVDGLGRAAEVQVDAGRAQLGQAGGVVGQAGRVAAQQLRRAPARRRRCGCRGSSSGTMRVNTRSPAAAGR
jgi:hypothetical protein